MEASSSTQALIAIENVACDDLDCNTVSVSDAVCTDAVCKNIPFTEAVCDGRPCVVKTINFDSGVCVDPADCKTLRFSHSVHFEDNTFYLLILRAHVKDKQGKQLASPRKWSFKTKPFTPPPEFIAAIAVDEDGDTGECTAIDVDQDGTIHIVYYSEEEGLPKHAFCRSDCDGVSNWQIESIDLPVADQKLGRDINLAIEGNVLHVSYRDVDPPEDGTSDDERGVLKYAKGSPNGNGWNWQQGIVDDTEDGVTNTYIAVSGGGVHISYAKQGETSSDDVIAYATCPASCDPFSEASWKKLYAHPGDDTGAPNHIVVVGTTVYISYYADEELWYATCSNITPTFCADDVGNWEPVAIDDGGGQVDAGRENSLAVDATGIHVTYRVTDSDGNSDLKYAWCASNLTCSDPLNWEKITIDPPDREGDNANVRVGGSSQVKIGVDGALHVSYRDDENKDLMYATCPSECTDPGQWSVYRIDAPGDVGSDTYLAVDNGTVHISYRAAGDAGDLKYARGIP
jgi:hypothetical protein